MFVHTVYFYAKQDATEMGVERLKEDCLTLLREVPTVKGLWAGGPAGTRREVIDHSYAVGLTVLFEDMAGHDVYQTHPKHLEFIERNKGTWERVQVYDFVDEGEVVK